MVIVVAWKPMEKFNVMHYEGDRILSSMRDVIDQTRGRVFPPISKHREVGWKNKEQPSVFLTNFKVFGNRRNHSFECLI